MDSWRIVDIYYQPANREGHNYQGETQLFKPKIQDRFAVCVTRHFTLKESWENNLKSNNDF